MNKIKKDDMVLIIKGKDQGKKGKVIKVIPAEQKIIVEEVNIAKKHMKPTQESQGGIVEIPVAFNWAKAMVICPVTGKPTKVGFKTVDGVKKRFAKSSGEIF